MVDAVRIGMTESSHLPGGAKNYLMDGLELLATDRPPAITAETAGRIALIALKHELDNTPRLGRLIKGARLAMKSLSDKFD